MKRLITAVSALLLAALLVLTGCGGGDDSSELEAYAADAQLVQECGLIADDISRFFISPRGSLARAFIGYGVIANTQVLVYQAVPSMNGLDQSGFAAISVDKQTSFFAYGDSLSSPTFNQVLAGSGAGSYTLEDKNALVDFIEILNPVTTVDPSSFKFTISEEWMTNLVEGTMADWKANRENNAFWCRSWCDNMIVFLGESGTSLPGNLASVDQLMEAIDAAEYGTDDALILEVACVLYNLDFEAYRDLLVSTM